MSPAMVDLAPLGCFLNANRVTILALWHLIGLRFSVTSPKAHTLAFRIQSRPKTTARPVIRPGLWPGQSSDL